MMNIVRLTFEFIFHCCENRDTNSSDVSLQGFSKKAPSGAGMDSLIEHKGWLWDPV